MNRWRFDETIDEAMISAAVVRYGLLASDLACFFCLDTTSPPAKLLHFWVHPNQQRKGVGKSMLNEVVQVLKRYNLSSAEVVAEPNAAEFYRRNGWRIVGSWHNDDVDQDLPVMRLDVAAAEES